MRFISLFLFSATLYFAIVCQNTSLAQVEQNVDARRQTEQENKTQHYDKCAARDNHGPFVFIGQVKEILPYQNQKLSQANTSYYHPESNFKPQQTIRFTVEKIYFGLEQNERKKNEIKEITGDVFASDTELAPAFELGEKYLVYATPRYYGKNDFNLEDNLIIYPDTFTQPVSQSQERIRVLDNPPKPNTASEIFGINLKGEKVLSGGFISSRGYNLFKPKHPVDAEGKKISGTVNVMILVNEQGKVMKAIVVCSAHHSLGKVSKEAAMKSKFTPTKVAGKPMKVTGVIVYHFVAQ